MKPADRSASEPREQTDDLVRLPIPSHLPMPQLFELLARPVEKAMRLDQLNRVYAATVATPGSSDSKIFLAGAFEQLGISYRIAPEDLRNIPATGAVVVVANHPFGAIEGMILAQVLASVRPDVKIMANFLLGRMPALRDLFILVNPFAKAALENMTPLRECFRHLKAGGMLSMFPAGEVASFDFRSRRIIDPPWTTHVARFVRQSEASVLPVYFSGHNSLLFQLAGMVHPRLRTALLARELLKLHGTCVEVRIGGAIPFARLSRHTSETDLVEHLRCRTYALACRSDKAPRTKPAMKPLMPTIPPVAASLLEAEVQALPPEALLADGGDMATYIASAGQIPCLLREIGRLREVSFRATGEGTGRELDLDPFDQHYEHLFIWHRKARDVVGAYRICYCDQILARYGIKGLYTHSLFKIRQRPLQKLGQTIELGRAFVRQEYQRSFTPLMMLWKGIGALVCRKPQYGCLLGPVSISNTYQTLSRRLMVDFLKCQCGPEDLGKIAKPRNPFPDSADAPMESRFASQDAQAISDLITDLEDDGKGMPVLLRQYLKLGARALAFNVDPDFSDVLDALLVIDLRKTPPRILDRYLGKEGRQSFFAYHHVKPTAAGK